MTDTKVTIRLNTKKDSKLAGFASVNVLNMFTVDGIKLWRNQDGIGVQMPFDTSLKKNPKTDKPYQNTNFSYNNAMHQAQFNELIIAEYNQKIGAEVQEKAPEALM